MLAQHSEEAFDRASQSIFRIEGKWWGGNAVGTAFAVARLQESKRLVVGTARHVIAAGATQAADWLVQQFDRNGVPTRELRYRTDPFNTHPEVFLHEKMDRDRRKMDCGILVLAERGETGKQFSPDDEEPLAMIDETRRVDPGTLVGWAGFAGVADRYLGHPQLCYYQGVISATIDRDDKRYYLVDGHNTYGVSGAPVWRWSEDRGFEVVGIVSGYSQDDELPGFCRVEPLVSFGALFRSWQAQWDASRG